MENLLGLSSGFFKEPSVEKWKTACAAGFTEVELCPGSHLAVNIPAYLETAETEYSMISRAGLRISSFHLPYGAAVDVSGPGAGIAEKAVSDNKIILDWAAGKGIGIAVLHASFEPVKPEDRPARLAQAIASIEKLSGYARERNIRLAVEDLPRTCLGNCADEMLALTNQGKSAAICFDVNHLLSKESHRKFFEKTSAHIITVHFSDYDRIDERHWIPGDGCIDWRELIGLFTRAGYRGRYLFELNEDSSPGLGRPFSPRELKERFFEISADHSRKMFYVCGQDSVFEIDTEKSSGTDVRYVWTWNKKETSGDLPGDIRESNSPVNDCKSVGNGTRILVTDGYCTLLLEKKTKKALFYAYTPNSHSSALLPGNRIAVALSTAEGGNAIQLYDSSRSNRALYRDDFAGCHGVIWNSLNSRLYVLGDQELRKYSLEDWASDLPKLKSENKWPLPAQGGHDLFMVNESRLVLTTHKGGVYEFDIRKETFALFPPLGDTRDVKSVYYDDEDGLLLYTVAEDHEERWWTENICMKNPDKKITISGFRAYKARAAW